MVLLMFRRLVSVSTASAVSKICATEWLYSPKILSYIYISSHCPMAASACFFLISEGRLLSPVLPMPTPTAPEDTSMMSSPLFCKSASTLQSDSMRR